MREIVFVHQQDFGKIHTLTACVGLDGALVFDEDDCREGRGCEMDDYLAIHARHKPAVLHHLVLAFDGISDTCGEHPDERLLCALQALADLGHWQSLGEIEAWLLERDIPFTKQHWPKVE
jgi:hypothetical protein